MKIEKTFVIYGAGRCGQSTLSVLQNKGLHVVGFLDRDASGEVAGLTCFHPGSAQATSWRESGAELVLAVWNFAVDLSLLRCELEGQGWQNVVDFPEICEQWGAPLEPFWVAPRSLYELEETPRRIAKARKLWSDEKSNRLFEIAIECRRSGSLRGLNEAAQAQAQKGAQYFPSDLPNWPIPKCFVDCGAFDGDTLKTLPAETQRVAAFEPDTNNFQKLSKAAHDAKRETLLWPCGVWSETTALSFNQGNGGGSHIDGKARTDEARVPVVALDDVLQKFAPDMIKMDIEGAELSALSGAREIIKKYRPALAICVYHRPEHLWEIPLWISALGLPCKFYLRAHGFNGFDLVLYCVFD